MKSFKKLIGTLVGSIGALTGISVLMNACNEEQDNKPVVEVTSAQVQQCCGTDQADSNYFYCVNRYIYTGTCITSESLQKCCGSKYENGDAYTSCVEDYIKTGSCSGGDHEWEAIPAYGMPEPLPPDDSTSNKEIEECCGKDDGSVLYHECAAQFDTPKKTIFCFGEDSAPIDDLPTVYGPAPDSCCDDDPRIDDTCDYIFYNTGVCPTDPGNEGLEDCCRGIANPEELNICVKDYVNTGLCLEIDDAPIDPPVYGPAPEP